MVMLGVLPTFGFSAESANFVVNQVKIDGLSRISSDTVMKDIPVEDGQTLSTQDTSQIISDLYQTGYFNDIKLYRQNNNLVIQVKERPAISAIDISGNDAIKTDDLKKGLTMAGLDVGNIYNPDLLKQIKQSLEMEYYNLGKYAVQIVASVIPLTRNRVDIKIKISEGKTAKIRRIDIIGNKKYTQSTLRDELVLTTPSIWNLWGLLTSDDQYSTQRMQSSIEQLRSYYMDRGYIDFNVESHQVSLNPNKDNTYVTMNISPGKVYKVSKIDVEGKLILPREKVRGMISLDPGAVFSRKELLDSSNRIKEALGKKGYAFAQVNPVPTIDRKDRTVAVTFYIQPGKKVYVSQINFKGNAVTNDNVYRREMLYSEGGIYNSYMIEQSKLKLQRLPYVEKVTMKKVPVPGTDDMVNLDYDIKERSANSVTASLGYSQLYKFMVGASLNMPNLLGTGNQVSLSTQLSKPYKSLSLSYTNPYFTQSGISQTMSAYVTDVDTASTTLANYSTDSYGFNLGYGIPLTINDTVNLGAGFDHTSLISPGAGTGSSNTVSSFIKQNGDSFNSYMVNIGWTRNTSNRAYFPTRGDIFTIGGQASVPGSDLTWYKTNIKNSWFHPITDFFTFSAKTGVDYGNGYGSTDQLPFFQNYYGGGWGSVRGFNQGSMGPHDALSRNTSIHGSSPTEGNALGGNLNVYANFNALFPIPGVKDSSNMRMGAFFDMGNVYSTYQYKSGDDRSVYEQTPRTPTFANLRYSVGIEFQWLSPMGPLAFSFAKPLNSKPGDDTQIFQFSLGQSF